MPFTPDAAHFSVLQAHWIVYQDLSELFALHLLFPVTCQLHLKVQGSNWVLVALALAGC